jgi:MFS family permease
MDSNDLQRAMRWSIADGALATVMGTMTSGVFLAGLALALGASDLQIGILAGMPPFATIMQLLGSYLIERFGRRKRLCFWASLSARLLWLPMIAVAMLPFGMSGQTAVWGIAVILALVSCLNSIAGVAWLSWTRRLVPDDSRVAFLGRRNFMTVLLSLSLGMLVGVFLDQWNVLYPGSLGGFVIVLALALAAGFCSSYCMAKVPPADPEHHEPPAAFAPLVRLPFQQSNFRRVILFYVLWNLSVNVAAPFFAVFMLRSLELPFWYIAALTTLSSVAGLLLNGFWARLTERFGIKPVIFLATTADALVPLAWIFVGSPGSALLVVIHLFGAFGPPLAMGPNNLVLRLAPATRASAYMAVFSATVGVVSAIAAIGGGAASGIMTDLEWSFAGLSFGALRTIFLLSFAGRLASLFVLHTIDEPQARRAREAVAHIRRGLAISVGRRRQPVEQAAGKWFVVNLRQQEAERASQTQSSADATTAP